LPHYAHYARWADAKFAAHRRCAHTPEKRPAAKTRRKLLLRNNLRQFSDTSHMRIMRAEATAIEQSCCEDDAAGMGAGNSIFKERAHRVRGEEAAELYV